MADKASDATLKTLVETTPDAWPVWPLWAAGKLRVFTYKQFPLGEAAEAHRLMESSRHIGKILLVP